MLKAVTVLLLALFAGMVWKYLPPAAHIATGYSAKQLCSGVLVAGLPEQFVVERDINAAMAILGPARSLLELHINEGEKLAEARLLGFSSIAKYRPATGCTLNPSRKFFKTALKHSAVGSVDKRKQPVVAPSPALVPAFDRAFSEPVSGGRNTLALLVMYKGEVIAERYMSPVDVSTPMQGWSMNKSLVATWVGIAVKQGRLSLDQPVLQALRASGEALGVIDDNVDPSLTLFNLLHMESGFDFVETYQPGDDATRMLYGSNKAMWRVAPGNGHIYSPGEHFSYSSGDTNLAAFLWQSSLGDQPYYTWLEDNFFTPLGLTTATSEPDSTGVQVGSSYTYMTARDWGRVGQFWLDAWHKRNSVLPQHWQRQATRPSSSNKQGNYGLGFWLNTQGSQLPSLPKNVFYAGGHAGQRVMVFPDEGLVIVRLGLSEGGVDMGVEQFARQVLDSLQPVVTSSPGI